MTLNAKDLSPWFQAVDFRPAMVGPFQCRITEDYRGDKTEQQSYHMRWWDGENWSHPLDYDPDLDDEIKAPPKEQMIHAADEKDLMIYLERFDWRGFNSDQDPL